MLLLPHRLVGLLSAINLLGFEPLLKPSLSGKPAALGVPPKHIPGRESSSLRWAPPSGNAPCSSAGQKHLPGTSNDLTWHVLLSLPCSGHGRQENTRFFPQNKH